LTGFTESTGFYRDQEKLLTQSAQSFGTNPQSSAEKNDHPLTEAGKILRAGRKVNF